MKTQNKPGFLKQAIQASLENFQCDGIIVIPIWQDNNATEGECLVAPILFGGIDTKSVETLLLKASESTKTNRQSSDPTHCQPLS